jgi:hypothetical protein
MNRIIIAILFMFNLLCCAEAQMAEITVNYNFDSRPLTELIQFIERSDELQFFYLKKWTDSILIVQKQTPCSLEKLLNETLLNTNTTYFADKNKNIIICHNYRIETILPSYFSTRDNIKPESKIISEESSFIRNEQNTEKPQEIKNEIITIGKPGSAGAGSKVTISGVVTEKETGQPIAGVLVYLKDINIGTSTDVYGYYVLPAPPGKHELILKYLGRKDMELKITANGNGTLNLLMEERILELRGVVVTADKGVNVEGLQLGMDKIDNEVIKLVSSSMGEGDLIKTALLLPGVQAVGEGTSGFNVRGGSADQNLILLDGAPLFNSSHVFGFFSVFNPDIVKDFTLYKSSIPVQYGGRLSSVLDVSVKNGNLKKISVSGGISPVAARLSIDGPIVKDKITFLISGRSSYSDWVLRRTDIESLNNSSAYFLDLNTKIDYKINERNELTFSGYYSRDLFRLNSDTLYSYNNLCSSINLKHTFSKKIYGILSGIYSKYSYSVSSDKRIPYAFDLGYSINYLEGRSDFKWFLNSDHKLNFGASINKYLIDPGTMNPIGEESIISPKTLPGEQSVETGIYASDDYNITDKISISYGLRYSLFFALGPTMVYHYLPDAPRSVQNRIDSTFYPENSVSYHEGGPELRFSARYKTGQMSSVKISYTKMNQYLHMISNTTAISPTDLWKTSGPNLPGQKSQQISAGFFKDFKSNALESSIEVYYKRSEDILEYRGGTVLIMNPDLEVDLLNGNGKAYGMEILFKKKYGALNGWVCYTYSRSMIKVDSKYMTDQINKGNYFPSNYDKPHDFTLVANYKISRSYNISSTITYSTGRPITYPVGKYQFRDREYLHYSNRNEYRVPDYFRWDLALNIEGKLRVNKLIHDSMSLSVYNLTGRDNAYSIYFINDGSKNVKGYKLSVFSQPVFSVTYNFRF